MEEAEYYCNSCKHECKIVLKGIFVDRYYVENDMLEDIKEAILDAVIVTQDDIERCINDTKGKKG